MQKLVKGATKPKATAPKAKYIEPILATTFEAGRDFDAVMDNLAKVIARGGAWPSIYKALIVVHIMIREGADEVTLKYLARHPHMLEIADTVHRAPAMGRYARYLTVRGQQFREIKVDFIRYKSRQGFSRLHSLPVQKGLMRECSSVLVQLDALMKCQLQEQDIVNDDVLLMAFRLLVHDVLSLFQVLNEGVINLLEHFFELSKPDAEQALDIYRGFRRLTSKVIAYLHAAKDLEFKTRVHVPNIKHAPTSLVSSLEMYLNDPDFDTNRRQYLAEKQAHEVKRTKSQQSRSSSFGHAAPAAATKDAPPPTASNPAAASASQAPLQQQQPPPPQTLQLQGQPPAPAQPQVLPQSTLQQTLAPGSIQMVSPELSTNSNPFWQSQQDAAQIQARDGQAQLQMQQIQQLHLQQLEQQERIRQQIQQLEQQNQQHAQHAQHAQQYQPAPQPQQPTIQQVPYMEPAHTGYDPGFDFGLGPQQPSQQQQQQQQQQPMLQQAPLQPQLTQPQQLQQLQPQYTQPQQLQPQYTQPMQAQTPQPVQAQATGGAAYTNPFQHTSPGSTNPFKTPQQTQFNQFDQFDQIGNQIGAQQSLIDFGQPQQTYQPTGTNPFRV